MPKSIEGYSYDHFIKKLVILGIFILVMIILIPFFYGWVNGLAHARLCEAIGIRSAWSCGLIVREPNILQGYIQLGSPPSSPASPLPNP